MESATSISRSARNSNDSRRFAFDAESGDGNGDRNSSKGPDGENNTDSKTHVASLFPADLDSLALPPIHKFLASKVLPAIVQWVERSSQDQPDIRMDLKPLSSDDDIVVDPPETFIVQCAKRFNQGALLRSRLVQIHWPNAEQKERKSSSGRISFRTVSSADSKVVSC
eukprot:GHVU01172061.1.p1 GENE.GHVU01172061.1~~GHVU01172061.1.p1  ORF type:complete len:168 (-),score=13.73 GHVU01172061.1:139-642(-)